MPFQEWDCEGGRSAIGESLARPARLGKVHELMRSSGQPGRDGSMDCLQRDLGPDTNVGKAISGRSGRPVAKL